MKLCRTCLVAISDCFGITLRSTFALVCFLGRFFGDSWPSGGLDLNLQIVCWFEKAIERRVSIYNLVAAEPNTHCAVSAMF